MTKTPSEFRLEGVSSFLGHVVGRETMARNKKTAHVQLADAPEHSEAESSRPGVRFGTDGKARSAGALDPNRAPGAVARTEPGPKATRIRIRRGRSPGPPHLFSQREHSQGQLDQGEHRQGSLDQEGLSQEQFWRAFGTFGGASVTQPGEAGRDRHARHRGGPATARWCPGTLARRRQGGRRCARTAGGGVSADVERQWRQGRRGGSTPTRTSTTGQSTTKGTTIVGGAR